MKILTPKGANSEYTPSSPSSNNFSSASTPKTSQNQSSSSSNYPTDELPEIDLDEIQTPF
jgi:hypothetical protein